MLTRRELLETTARTGAAVLLLSGRHLDAVGAEGELVNDRHSRLNATRVRRVIRPGSVEALQDAVREARRGGHSVSVAGGRHAMGGQQFAEDALLIDMTGLDRLLRFDPEGGLVEAQAGIEWPALMDHLLHVQAGRQPQWGICQKQTGADGLSLGGALAANIHGRGLRMRPIVQDVESFVLVDARGERHTCSRRENAELFSLAIGGYGLFGIIAQVTLRLARRHKIERVVQLLDAGRLAGSFERRIEEGFEYGDFQYAIDPAADNFLREGVFACYRPVPDATPIPEHQTKLTEADWRRMLYLAHAQPGRAFDEYAGHYLATNGQVYWSDTHQRSTYVADYHRDLDRQLGARHAGTEMISEVYVPRPALPEFLDAVRDDFRRHKVPVIYGTIRLIERDNETFLAWAREPFACIIFNLHIEHTPAGRAKAAQDFRRLIDRGLDFGGSFYLTYHRWATREQIERAHPRFAEFLRLKKKHDPEERFQSTWYRHSRDMFADRL